MLSPNKIIAGRSAADWISSCPVVGDICELMETAWLNPDKQPFEQAKAACPLGMADIGRPLQRKRSPGASALLPCHGLESL